jgi:Cu+-exporting ATPase
MTANTLVFAAGTAKGAGESGTYCAHCGDPCPAEYPAFDEKAFCCEGCKTVYDILQNNGLCKYYEIDEKAGISLKGKKVEGYAYLDDPEVIGRLLDFSDGKQARATFFLPQVHCASCIWLLENLYKLSDGILSSTVHFLKKELTITYAETRTSLRAVVELLAGIGYAPAINLGSLDAGKRPVTDRSFVYKLGVAGFAFGNIMLLSFPEYLGLGKTSDPMFFRLFGYLNILLAIPVVSYSAADYFKAAWLGLKQRALTIDFPLALGILVYFLRSVYEIYTHSDAGYMDSLAGLVFFLLAGKWFQQRTYHHISFERDYRSYFPIAASKKEDGKEIAVSLDRLKTGDIIVVRNGELIPADAIVLRGLGRIDYSFVTGEAEPVEVHAGEAVFAGGRQQGPGIELSLTKQVSQSYLTQLWNESAFSKKQELQTSRIANSIGKYFTAAILLIGFGAFFYWLPSDAGKAVNAFTAVLIVACPCAVALAIPFIFGNVLRHLGKHRFYLKNTQVIEALREADAIVVDKTGTITTRQKGEYTFVGQALDEATRRAVLTLAAQSQHPLSQILRMRLEAEGVAPIAASELRDWKEEVGKGICATIGGTIYRLGSRDWMEGRADLPDTGEEGVWLQAGNQVPGVFVVAQYLRPQTAEVLAAFRSLGELHLLSGDNEREKALLSPFFEHTSNMHFRKSPLEKLQFIKALQQRHLRVLMFGDGLNDAGALKQSDIGIVVTDDASNFTPASDAILHAESYPLLPQLLSFAGKSVQLVFGAYGLALIYNIIGLSFAVQGTLSPLVAAILMPLSSVTTVLFGLVGSNWLARRHGL